VASVQYRAIILIDPYHCSLPMFIPICCASGLCIWVQCVAVNTRSFTHPRHI